MNKIEKMQQRINKRFPNEKITVLEATLAKEPLKIRCDNCGKMYEFAHAETAYAKRRQFGCHDCGSRLVKKQGYINRLKEKYPNDDLEIISFTKREEPAVIQCKKCGTQKTYKIAAHALDRRHRNFFCDKCHPQKIELSNKTKEKFIDFINQSDQWELVFDISKENIQSRTLIACKCKKCGAESSKTMADYLRGRGCLYCSHTRPISQEEFAEKIEEDFELLTPYKSIYEKVKIRHKTCGFIREVAARQIWKNGNSCPKCSKKRSIGEAKIAEFLRCQEIDFIQEYKVRINNHLLSFDFYLPEQDLYIEFNGIQHYESVKHFGGEERFLIQKEYDLLKQQFALNKLLIVPYWDIDNIDSILNKALKFND